jgi:hypothetical protein
LNDWSLLHFEALEALAMGVYGQQGGFAGFAGLRGIAMVLDNLRIASQLLRIVVVVS